MKFFIPFLVLLALAAARHIDEYRVINPHLDWRVVGGEPGHKGQFPFMVSLRTQSGNHNCGGTIISQIWILTAAHCVIGMNPSDTTVVAGSHLLSSGGDHYNVESVILNGYQPITFQNDISLLKLTSDIKLGDFVAKIALETHHADHPREATLVGWGTTILGGQIPDNIQYVAMETATHDECQSYWSDFMIFTSSLCTQPKNGQGACHGDSGGPLIIKETKKQAGIVSWGFPCAEGYPDVFTRVSHYDNWIRDTINH